MANGTLTFELPSQEAAAGWCERLRRKHVIVDARGDRLRFGFGLYQDEMNVDRLLQRLEEIVVQT